MALLVEGHQLKAADLSERLDTTPGFIPQVIGPLVKAGWVRSDPGPSGGYVLTGSPGAITVLDVIEAVDGPTDTGTCVVADLPCGHDAPCALHAAWTHAREELTASLRAETVADLAAGSKVGVR